MLGIIRRGGKCQRFLGDQKGQLSTKKIEIFTTSNCRQKRLRGEGLFNYTKECDAQMCFLRLIGSRNGRSARAQNG